MGLSYRFYRDEDQSSLERMWQESTDWGSLTKELWQKAVVENPFGAPLCCLATEPNTEEIVGLMALMPSVVRLNEREVRAFRPGAPIISKSARSLSRNLNPLQHPMIEMTQFAINGLRERGGAFLYMLPHPNWTLLLRFVPGLICNSFPLWSLPLPLTEPFQIDSSFRVSLFSEWDDRIDRLWEVASRQFGCAVVRDSRYLPGKAPLSMYKVLGVERGGDLVGVVCSRQKGDRQWLICDILSADEQALRATLMAVCNLSHMESRGAPLERPIAKVAILVTPALEATLSRLGFRRDQYNFPLVIRILDDRIKPAELSSDQWYLSAND